MASEFGKDWRVKVQLEGNTTYATIGGEGSFDINRSSKEIDTSSKDDGEYGTAGFGRQTIAIPVNGKLKLPDPGLQRVVGVSKAAVKEVIVQIVKVAGDDEIVKFQGLMAVSSVSTSHPDDEVCTWRTEFKSAAAPTVDDIGATA